MLEENMTEKKNIMTEKNVPVSVQKLLFNINYEKYQTLKSFLMHSDCEEATALLDLLDNIAELYQELTGKDLSNRFQFIEQYQNLFKLVDLSNAAQLSLDDFAYVISDRKILYAPNNTSFTLYYKNLKVTIANSVHGLTILKPVYVSEETVSDKNYTNLKWTELTEAELEAANIYEV